MENKPVKYKRSMSLSKKLNDDLLTLTEALGVNAHSYMINEIAKSVQRDSLSLQVKKTTDDQLTEMIKVISRMGNDPLIDVDSNGSPKAF